MTVYLVVNDPPPEYNTYGILKGFLYKSKAETFERQLKAKDAYTYQYVTVVPVKVEA